MALTKTDLKQIAEDRKQDFIVFRKETRKERQKDLADLRAGIFTNHVTRKEFQEYRQEASTRFERLESKINDVQDVVVQTYQFLTSMFPLTQAQVEFNTSRINVIETRLDQIEG